MTDEGIVATISNRLAALERETSTPRQIALLRIRVLLEEGVVGGLAATIVPLLRESCKSFTDALINGNDDDPLPISVAARVLRRVLELHLHLCQQDVVLGEELAREGSHILLSKFISSCFDNPDEAIQDVLMELQDLACEIATCARKFPVTAVPCVDLKGRLPLVFQIDAKTQALIHQVTSRQSAQADVGFGT